MGLMRNELMFCPLHPESLRREKERMRRKENERKIKLKKKIVKEISQRKGEIQKNLSFVLE
jgi:hypothetical protein